tara:strand:- start:38 stop:607 length:570 start_codon:yes stop_codon:yes gene_type:complete
MAGLPLLEKIQKIAKAFGNIISGDDTVMDEYLQETLKVDKDALNKFAEQTADIESSGGKNLVNKKSGAKGNFQFKTRGKGNSFQTALNRAEDMYNKMGKNIPTWVTDAQKHNNPLKLTYEQEKDLFLADMYNRSAGGETTEWLTKIGEGDEVAKWKLYEKYHHTNPDLDTRDRAFEKYNIGTKGLHLYE